MSGACPFCGDDVSALTTNEDGLFYEDDQVKCNGCGEEGSVIVNEDGGEGTNSADAQWENEPE